MSFVRDLELAGRAHLRRPAFALIAVGCLGLGLGGVAAGYSLVRGVILAPLPYERSHELVRIWNQLTKLDLPRLNASAAELTDYRRATEIWAAVEAYVGPTEVGLIEVGEPERVRAAVVTPGLLALLGKKTRLGRDFRADEGIEGNNKVCLLSHGFWLRRFGGRANILGEKVLLEEEGHEVVGVLPPSFRFPEGEVDLLAPLALSSESPRTFRNLRLIGRLAPGLSLSLAQRQMSQLAARLQETYPDVYHLDSGWGVHLVELGAEVAAPLRSSLWLLFAGLAVVLLIACANVAGLLVARGLARQGQLGVQKALGASSAQLVRRELAESVWLALGGVAAGLLLAYWALPIALSLSPTNLPPVRSVAVDAGVAAATTLAALALTVAFATWPAIAAARVDPRRALGEDGRSAGGSKAAGRTRRLLVGVELALSGALLVAAGLLAASLRSVERVDPGFETTGRASLQVLMPGRYADGTARITLLSELLSAAAAEPAVTAVAAISNLPLATQGNTLGFAVVGREPRPGEGRAGAEYRVVTADYHRVLGIELIAGRTFNTDDDARGLPVVLIDETLSRRHFPQGDAVGSRLELSPEEPLYTVVGVVGAVHHHGLDEAARGHVYFVYPQDPVRGMTLVASGRGEAGEVGAALRRAVLRVDSRLALPAPTSLEQLVERSFGSRRFALWLVGCFTATAMLLSALGVYGILSFSIGRRRRELAVRLAFGANRLDITRAVLSELLPLLAAATTAALLLGMVAAKTLSSFLFGVSPFAPRPYLVAALLLVAVAALAALIPTLRAIRTDPVAALRSS